MAAAQPNASSASLYVGDLAPEVTEAVLFEYFNPIGNVASIRVCRDSVTRRSLGYAYVNFHEAAHAERAMDVLNFSKIKDRQCRIMWCHRDPGLRKSGAGNLFVKNLDKSVDNKALFDTFSVYGNILSCKVATDESGKSLGFGFVHFDKEEDAQKAIEASDSITIGSKPIFVTIFKSKKERNINPEDFHTNCYVNGFPTSWNEETLINLFSKFGEITSSAFRQDKKGRGFGFVNFSKVAEAQEAKTLDGRICNVEANEVFSSEEGEAFVAKIEERKKAAEEKGETFEAAAPENIICKLYVGRAQSRLERQQILRAQFANVQINNIQPKAPQGVNLYVKNLEDNVDDAKLREEFEKFGAVTSARVMKDESGASRGFGFVNFQDPESATKAVSEMHLKKMGSKALYVGLAERREHRLARLKQAYQAPSGAAQNGSFVGQPTNNAFFRPGMPVNFRGRMVPPMGSYPMFAGIPAMNMNRNGRPANMRQNRMNPQQMLLQQQKMMAMQQQQIAVAAAVAANANNGNNRMDAKAVAFARFAAVVNSATPEVARNLLGERLYAQISVEHPSEAGKITGMMLEMDTQDLLALLSSEAQLSAKVSEALNVLSQAAVVPTPTAAPAPIQA